MLELLKNPKIPFHLLSAGTYGILLSFASRLDFKYKNKNMQVIWVRMVGVGVTSVKSCFIVITLNLVSLLNIFF